MAQAEHDPLAACYLVTFSDAYADAVEAAIQVHLADSTRADITRTSLEDHGLIVVCTSMEQALEAVNVIAPEHLEMHVEGAMEYLGAIRNAGAIFLGAWTPEAVGDYVGRPQPHAAHRRGTARLLVAPFRGRLREEVLHHPVQPGGPEERRARRGADRHPRGAVGHARSVARVLRRCWTPSRPSVAGSAAAGVEDGEARGE